MTPKEKAKELIEKFKPMCLNVKDTGIINGLATVMNDDVINFYSAKECALIAVEELIRADWQCEPYWQEVKHEIENLKQ